MPGKRTESSYPQPDLAAAMSTTATAQALFGSRADNILIDNLDLFS